MIGYALSGRPAQRRHRVELLRAALLLLYSALFLGILVPQAGWPVLVLVTLLPTSVALWFGPLSLLGSQKGRHWYDPATAFNLAMFYYCLKGISIAGGQAPRYLWATAEGATSKGYVLASLFVTAGLVAWNGAYGAVLRRGMSNRQAAQVTSSNTGRFAWPAGNLKIGVALLSFVGVVSLQAFLMSTGADLLYFVLHPLDRSYLASGILGTAPSPWANFWQLGSDMFPVASLIWLATFGRAEKRPTVWWWLHASISVVIYSATGGRADVLGFVLSAAVIYHLLVAPLSPRLVAVLGIASIVYAYVVNLWRSAVGAMSSVSMTAGGTEVFSQLSTQGLYRFLSGTDLTDIRLFVLIVDACGRLYPFQYGRTLLRIGSQFVPRLLWPGKPLDLSLEISYLFQPGALAGTPPGFFAEMYLNLHAAGVILGGALLGAGLAQLYRTWIATKSARGVLFYAILLPRVLLLPSGTFANIVNSAIVGLLGVALAFVVAKLFARSNGPSWRRGLVPQE